MEVCVIYGNISHIMDGSGCELCVRVTVYFMLYVYNGMNIWSYVETLLGGRGFGGIKNHK